MQGYAIRNLEQVEDMAPKFGFGNGFEARFARRDLGCERIGISYQKLSPNTEGPFGHAHGQDEEVYVVVSGSGRVKLGDEVVEIDEWDAIRVAPQTLRAFAAGPDGLAVLAFGTHTEDDVSMRQVQW